MWKGHRAPDTRTLAQLIAGELGVGRVTTLLARDVREPTATGAINTRNFIAGVLDS